MHPELNREIRQYAQAIALERVFPRRARQIVKAILFVLTLATFVASLLFVVEQYLSVGLSPRTVLFAGNGSYFFGWFLIFFSLLFLVSMLSFFYNAIFYRGIESITHEGMYTAKRGISYEVGVILARGHDDLTAAFFTSRYGREILHRCNIDDDHLNGFLNKREEMLSVHDLQLPEKGFLTLEQLALHIFTYDSGFAEFLFRQGVTEETFMGAALWAMRTHHTRKHDTRWWSRENLGKLPVVGQAFGQGGIYMLERFSLDINTTAVFSVLTKDVAYADEKVEAMESALSRAKNANVVIVGEQGVGKMDLVIRLKQKIQSGEATPNLLEKRIYVLDTDGFIAAHDNKAELEQGLIELFDQTARAGSVVVAIDDLPHFLESAASIGVNVAAVLDMYFASSAIQFIVTSDPAQYHRVIESKPTLTSRFEKVTVENPDLSSSIAVLQKAALQFEKKYHLLFTYPSIWAVAESADRYITEGVMPNKAIDLLAEIGPEASRRGIRRVTKEFVYSFVSTKTGIPTGPVQDSERDTLLHLEDVLHERVIGQKHAIKAISGVMRRARAGVQDANRPLGSFLFLGSTGVGKTETAKALAYVFFGAEDNMSRLDMSEYSGEDGVVRLIGDGAAEVGSLSMLLQEKPYGVLLLDEFEKASSSVHDLFLQIVDEGYFTNARGKKVNARNSIIIATSNAGATMIWDLAKREKDPNESKDAIIENIIKDGVYKPELINRFDGVIVFEPLKLDEQEKIARLMLEELQERIKQKGYELVVDDVLVSLLVSKGYDPEFGARPMRRVLQDFVEEKIAEKIIAGGLNPGDKIWFYEEDFASDEG